MAVVSALLIATLVAVIAASMITRQSAFARAVEAEQQRAQGAWLLRGALEWSRQLLWEQRRLDPVTRLDQGWARPIQALRLNERNDLFDGAIEDEQGKFNLRNLVANDREDAAQLASFQRLCAVLGVSPKVADAISRRVIEAYPRRLADSTGQAAVGGGFDSGRVTSPNAASRLLPARRPMLRSLDDLAGQVDEDSLARLRPFVTILPATTWVNGNTTRAEVLVAHVPGLTLQRARGLLAERDSGRWFVNRGDFFNRLRMPHLAMDSVQIGITSDWFLVTGHVRQQGRRVPLQALLQRGDEARPPRIAWSRVGA